MTPCLLLGAVGCGDAVAPAPVAEAGGVWHLDTARGPVALPYRAVGGYAVADDDMILGRVDRVRLRDFHAGDTPWSNGIIPYVWDINTGPYEECSVDKQRFCYGEWEYLTQYAGPGAIPIWEQFKQHVVAETSLSLVDATECFYDPSCSDYLVPGNFMFVRRAVSANENDNQTECLAVNNTKIQLTAFTLEDTPGETWKLDIGDDSWTIPGTGVAGDDAQAIVDALVGDPDYDDLPITVTRDGDTVKLQAKQPEQVTITLVGMVTNDDNIVESGDKSCVGGDACENSDCPFGTVCIKVWPYDQPYDQPFALDDEGYCQQEGGSGTVVPIPNDDDVPERWIGIPTSWFHTRHFGGMAHELLHVAGFVHEHQRPDNYEAVFTIADPQCELLPDAPDLDKNEDFPLYGWSSPLDWASSMMYASNHLCMFSSECENMCLNAIDGICPDNICAPNDAYNSNKPDPMLPDLDIIRRSGWFEGYDRLGNKIDRGELGLSYKDQDALRTIVGNAFAQTFVEGQCPWFPDDGDQLPEHAWSGAETRDAFGSSLAIGRFGDEDSGVLVGIPDEEEDWLDIKSGAATVWEGNRYMLELADDAPSWETTNPHLPAIPILAPDQFMVPQAFADDFPLVEIGDRFGFALAALDFNGDGIDEIAVGAPRAGFNNTGLVYLYHTNDAKKKHGPWQVLAPPSDLDAWEFGYALAAGNFAGKDNDDSCVSRHRQELAVGSPKMTDAGGNRPGAVYVYRWNSATQAFEAPRVVEAPVSDHNQRFGHALAAADLDGDHRDGLVVGAPMYGSTDVGRAYFFESDAPAEACDMQLQYKGHRTATASNARLGTAVAAGDFLRGTGVIASPDDVAIGAPRPGNVGYVELFKGTGAPLAVNTTFTPHATLQQVANGLDTDESGDEFGHALAVTEFSYVVAPGHQPRPAYLYIGAPSERNADDVQTGAVYQVKFNFEAAVAYAGYRGDKRDTALCPAGQDFGCDKHVVEPELAGRFGAAIAASRRILVIGDPSFDLPDGTSEISDVGAARIYVRERDPVAADAWYLMRWFTESNQWPTPAAGYTP